MPSAFLAGRFCCLLVILTTALPGAAVGVSGPPASKLARISVLGSKRYAQAVLVRASGVKPGAAVKVKNLKDAAARLGATGAFSEVTYRYQSTPRGIEVIFRVRDAAGFYPCRFTNFVWFDARELDEGLRTRVSLYAGEVPLVGNLADDVDTALEAMLKSRGIPGSVHHIMFGRAGGLVEAVQFRASGVPLPIRRVTFEGATRVEGKALQAAVAQLLGQDYDQPFARAFVENNVAPLFWEKGFLKASFGNPTAALVAPDKTGGEVAVTIRVEEGDEYRLGEIGWAGNKVFSVGELAASIRVRRGEPADSVELGRDVESLHALYAARGYLRASASLRPALDDSTHTASFEVDVREGDLYRMGRLAIVGLDSSHTQALAKNCRVRSGDPYDHHYWSGFLKDNINSLPRRPKGWNMKINQEIVEANKTVDVTLNITPAT